MKRFFVIPVFFLTIFSIMSQSLSSQFPGLAVYDAVMVLEDNQSVDFNGEDQFALNFDNYGNFQVVFYYPYLNGFGPALPVFRSSGHGYREYAVINPVGETLLFRLSNDKREILVTKTDFSDFAIGYVLEGTQYNSNQSPAYSSPSYSSPSYNEYGSSSESSTCRICHGTGVCSSCHGRGGEFRDSGYYTGSGSKSWIDCPSCNGSKKCFNCYGSGRQ